MTESRDPIRGKVARVLNSRELAINVGSQNGVRVGMKFDVMDPKGENITDPDTGEILGSLARPKVRIEVTQVTERVSVARTFKTRKVNVGGKNRDIVLDNFVSYLLPPRWVTEYETLKTDEKTWEDLDEKESYVKTGDPVAEVLEEERGDFPAARVESSG
ncbi:MAG: hypothetical protein QOH06_4922 [Acidobacteriota bacterium]|jgi:hypothetical protein|nr:hypothetical protein [Acidobacteriota bacterium]